MAVVARAMAVETAPEGGKPPPDPPARVRVPLPRPRRRTLWANGPSGAVSTATAPPLPPSSI